MALAPVGEVFAGSLVASISAPSTLEIATLLVIVPTLLVLAVPEVRQLRSVPLSGADDVSPDYTR